MKLLSLLILFSLSFTSLVAQKPIINKKDLIDIDDKENRLIKSFRDADGDGLGNFSNSIIKDHVPTGYVKNADDCDDANRYIGSARTYFRDADGDGYGNPKNKRTSCTKPSGYVSNSADCDDTSAKMNGSTAWYFDRDGDGWGSKELAYMGCRIDKGTLLFKNDKLKKSDPFEQIVNHASIDELLAAVTNNNDYDDSTINITNIAPKWFYRDADGDGYGNASVKVYYSNKPNGYVTNSSDCNDNNAAINPNTIWYKDGDGDGVGDTSETKNQCNTPSGYVLISGDRCPKLAGNEDGCPPLGQRAGLPNENYIYTLTPQEAVNQKGQLLNKKHQAAVTYYDGLGRPKQSVAVGVTPSGKDLVTHVGYDDFGRQHRDYLPVPASGSKGSFRDDAEAQTLSYYNDPAFDHTENPYTERIYEASPLNRVLEVGAPGNRWKANPNSDTDKTIKTDYGANGWDSLVRWFEVDFEQGNTQKPILKDKGVYPAAQLYKTTTKDENWRHYTYSQDSNKTETYTNKQGQVVLKRAFSNRSWHDTYYVYDDYGNLTFVIPPEVQTYASVWQQGDYKYVSLNDYRELFTTEMKTGGNGGGAYLSSWNKSISLFYYTYSHGDLTPKNGSHFDLSPMEVDLPAGSLSGWTNYTTADGTYTSKPISGYLIGNRVSVSGLPEVPVKQIYFNLSRVIGELRNDKPISTIQDQLESMMYQYRYDHRNRLVEKKIPGKDWEYIAYDTLDRPVLTADGNMRKAKQALKTEYDAFGRVTKTGLVTGVSGSSHDAFKSHIDDAITSLYTENYYDRYTDIDTQGLSLPSNAVTGTQTQGLQTGSKLRILDTSTHSTHSTSSGSSGSSGKSDTEPVEVTEGYITTLLGYDKKGRLIYSGTHNPATDVVSQQTHTLDFVGRTTQTTTVETKNGNTLTKVDDYAYDHAGRLIDHDLTLNGQKEDLVHNRYDELGQLEEKTVGGGLQTVDYDYNVRGWLRHINDPDALGDDLFGFELDYGSLYNGNIQRTYWNTANDNIKRNYRYNYDGLNRLTYATYYAPGSYWGAYRTSYTYDRNGNIKRLSRTNGERIGIDNLTYAYEGNQLQAVTDSYRNSEGFNDGNTSGFDYIYDTNGNLTQDKNKGVEMQYNHLNLPKHVLNKQKMRSLEYSYDATGIKHQKKFSGYGIATKKTTYTPTAVYKNNNLELVFTPEGYAEPKDPSTGSGGFTHVYQYKDHLGNNRLSYADANGNGKIETPGSTAVTVWEETFEDKSKGNNDWDGSGNSWGWEITDIVSNKAKSGSKSGMLQNTAGTHREIACHSNEWVPINIDKPTLFRYSGWVFIEPHNHYAEIFFFMKEKKETKYYTQLDRVGTATKGKWVYVEKVVVVPANIKTLNLRIDNDGTSGSKVWFDDLKIEQLDMSQNEIVSETNYYPFGLAHKGYNEHSKSSNLGENWKYLNQEHQKELGLNWITFRHRNYMPDVGRFFSVDPVSEEYMSISTYQFAHNNPIWKIELEGLEGITFNGEPDHLNIEAVTRVDRSNRTIRVTNTQNYGSGVTTNSSVKLILGNNVNQNHVTDYSAKVVGENLSLSGNSSARISSAFRDPKNQARVMFNNLESKGVENQRNLYNGKPGEKVIDTYQDAKADNAEINAVNSAFDTDISTISNSDIKSFMENKINLLGPGNVSKHSSNPNTYNVLDIAPSSVKNSSGFINTLKRDTNKIQKVITPKQFDPAIHIEINQINKYY